MVRKAYATPRNLRLGQSGELMELMPEEFDVAAYGEIMSDSFPLSAVPLKQRRLAKIGTIVSKRCHEGFSWHNICVPLSQLNWKILLESFLPNYILVESCICDSVRAWPQFTYNMAGYASSISKIIALANKLGVPAIFWHTLGPDLLRYYENILPAFDIVACADEESIESLGKKGLSPRSLPRAFSPEHFNPLTGPRLSRPAPRVVFDGLGRLTRNEEARSALSRFSNGSLAIVDSGLMTPPYNIARSPVSSFGKQILGNISQTRIQDLYKASGACLSLATKSDGFAPAWEEHALEAAACGIPVLHIGEETGTIGSFAKIFKDSGNAARYWSELILQPFAREREGHLAWRNVHKEHTFAHRMAAIHRWLNLPGDPAPCPLASIVTPSCRKDNFHHVMRQYEAQTWPNKELIFVFNGLREDMPEMRGRDDARIVHVPAEYAVGSVMNAGLLEAKGTYFFRMDDDDLYGPNYMADRMIYFNEFAIDSISNSRCWMNFADSANARITDVDFVPQDNTVFALGDATYRLLGFTGGSLAARRDFALSLGFMDAANSHADVAFLYKGMFFASNSAHLKIDPFNFCVKRNNPACHTWSAPKEELEGFLSATEVPMKYIFV